MTTISTMRVNTSDLTVEIRLPRMFGPRMRVAFFFIKIAALVSPITLETKVPWGGGAADEDRPRRAVLSA